jgi:hypothetical protein
MVSGFGEGLVLISTQRPTVILGRSFRAASSGSFIAAAVTPPTFANSAQKKRSSARVTGTLFECTPISERG